MSKPHQAVGIVHRELSQHQAVDAGEERHVRASPDGKRRDHDDRPALGFQPQARGKPDIRQHDVQRRLPADGCQWLRAMRRRVAAAAKRPPKGKVCAEM